MHEKIEISISGIAERDKSYLDWLFQYIDWNFKSNSVWSSNLLDLKFQSIDWKL